MSDRNSQASVSERSSHKPEGLDAGALLPCPFCGGEAKALMGLIGCEPCALARRDAKSWNTRAALPSVGDGEREALRQISVGEFEGRDELADQGKWLEFCLKLQTIAHRALAPPHQEQKPEMERRS